MPAQDTDDQREADGYRPDETQAERDDRNLADLLQELRVAGLGIQVIFGFMLGLPFTSKFSELGPGQRTLYIVTLLLAAVATALLVGPVAYHRLVFRRHLKRHLVGAANVMAILGLAAVALTVSAAVLLVVSYVAHGAPAVIIGVFVVCVFVGLWFVYPLTRHWDSQPEPPGPPAPPPGPSHDRRAGSGRH
jgi:MFS family permease